MPGDAGEIVVLTRIHPQRFWILIPLDIAGRPRSIDMVLDTGSPFSAISEPLRVRLLNEGRLEQVGSQVYVFRDVSIQGQPIADLPVRVSARVTAVEAEGILGLDFLNRFTDIHFNLPSMRLRLGDP